jgi:hypothetical protein
MECAHFSALRTSARLLCPPRAYIRCLGGGRVRHVAAEVNRVITRQTVRISFATRFDGLGIIFITLVVVVWLARPPFIAEVGPAAGGGHRGGG